MLPQIALVGAGVTLLAVTLIKGRKKEPLIDPNAPVKMTESEIDQKSMSLREELLVEGGLGGNTVTLDASFSQKKPLTQAAWLSAVYLKTFIAYAQAAKLYDFETVQEALKAEQIVDYGFWKDTIKTAGTAAALGLGAALGTTVITITAPIAAVVGMASAIFNIFAKAEKRAKESMACDKFITTIVQEMGAHPSYLLLYNLSKSQTATSVTIGIEGQSKAYLDRGQSIIARYTYLYEAITREYIVPKNLPFLNLKAYHRATYNKDVPAPFWGKKSKLRVSRLGDIYPYVFDLHNLLQHNDHFQSYENDVNRLKTILGTSSFSLSAEQWISVYGKGFRQFVVGHDRSNDGYDDLMGITGQNRSGVSIARRDYEARFILGDQAINNWMITENEEIQK